MKKLLLAILAIFLVSGMHAQLDSWDLLLYLDFEDDTELTLNDQDVTAEDVEYTAEYSTEAAQGAGAASFDGTQFIIFDANETINCQENNYTWAAWIKTSAEGGTIMAWAPFSGTPAEGNGEIDENDPHGPGVHALFWGFEGPTLTFDVGWVSLFVGANEIHDDEWHHVAVTVDVETPAQEIYFDGDVDGSGGNFDVTDYPDPNETPMNEFRMKVGYSSSEWPADEGETMQLPYFTGLMDEFRMYAGALTADDILELFELETAVNTVNYQDFKVYPNPATDYIRFTSVNEVSGISIYNAIGQEVLRKSNITRGSTIDVTSLENGIYFVKSQDTVQKLIIR